MQFVDRTDAGRRLAERLEDLRDQDVVVLALPRGGVPVGSEVAKALGAPLDVVLVRKLGVPFEPELGMGAIGEGGVRILNAAIVRDAGVGKDTLKAVEGRERAELERRARVYRGGRPRVSLEGRLALVVDDGIATGSTARVACVVARKLGAARVVFAAPVGPPDAKRMLAAEADEVIVLDAPQGFHAIGQFYDDFSQVPDDEVIRLLASPAPDAPRARALADGRRSVDAEATIPASGDSRALGVVDPHDATAGPRAKGRPQTAALTSGARVGW